MKCPNMIKPAKFTKYKEFNIYFAELMNVKYYYVCPLSYIVDKEKDYSHMRQYIYTVAYKDLYRTIFFLSCYYCFKAEEELLDYIKTL